MSSDVSDLFDEIAETVETIKGDSDLDFNKALLTWGLKVTELSELDFAYENLEGAKLSGAVFDGSDFSRANLKNAVLTSALLRNCKFFHTDLTGVDMRNSDVSGANFSHSILVGASLTDVNLKDSDLSYANLSHTEIKKADFEGLEMPGVIFNKAILESANFHGALLDGASFTGASVVNSNMTRCMLSNANFENADLTGTSFIATSFVGAKFRNTRMDYDLAIRLNLNVDEGIRGKNTVLICEDYVITDNDHTVPEKNQEMVLSNNLIIKGTLQRWLQLSSDELNDIYRNAVPGPIPTGDTRGTTIVTGALLPRMLARLSRLFAWQGKKFELLADDGHSGILINKITPLSLNFIVAKVYRDQSWLDLKDTIVIDYSSTSFFAKFIREEIRQIEPGLYLGKVWWRKTRILDFALTCPDQLRSDYSSTIPGQLQPDQQQESTAKKPVSESSLELTSTDDLH